MVHKNVGSIEPLQVDCVDSAEAIDKLQAIWQGLERQDDQCTPFNTWAWNSLWWHHYGTASDRLMLLIARRGNRVVALAPLFVHTTWICRVIPVKVLQFIGTGGDASPDYLNIIALRECRDEAERAFLDFLPSIKGWHKLHLTDILQSSSLADRVAEFVSTQPGAALTPRRQIIKKAALPSTFDGYCMQLSRNRREQINHRQIRLDAAGVSELCICATTDELAEASDALVSLHRRRWESKQRKGGFGGSSACEQFHRTVIRHFFASDALWLVTLKLDGSIIGVQYVFVWRGQLMFMQSGYSPEHESLSPGHVLFTYVIQRGIEQGLTGLDMLKGHSSCKSAFAADQNQTISLGHVRPGVRQLLGGAREWAARMWPKSQTQTGADTDS